MNIFSAFHISGSALTAEKVRLDVIAGNLANLNSTRTSPGGHYRRRTVVFAENLSQAQRRLFPESASFNRFQPAGRGVRIHSIHMDQNPPRLVYDPEHPDADNHGNVAYPNIELAREVTDLITSLRSYEANATVINTAKSLYLKALEIGR